VPRLRAHGRDAGGHARHGKPRGGYPVVGGTSSSCRATPRCSDARKRQKVHCGGGASFTLSRNVAVLTSFQQVACTCSKADGNGKVSSNGIITTIVGGASNPASVRALSCPEALAVDAFQNLYISDSCIFRIVKVLPNGSISVAAGEPFSGYGSSIPDERICTSRLASRSILWEISTSRIRGTKESRGLVHLFSLDDIHHDQRDEQVWRRYSESVDTLFTGGLYIRTLVEELQHMRDSKKTLVEKQAASSKTVEWLIQTLLPTVTPMMHVETKSHFGSGWGCGSLLSNFAMMAVLDFTAIARYTCAA
jgi:hypothetical protein